MRTLSFFLLLLWVLPIRAQQVHSAPDMAAPLSEKWDWAESQESRSGSYWIVHSIRKEMCATCQMGTLFTGEDLEGRTIEETLTGIDTRDRSVQNAVRDALDHIDGDPKRQVMKEVALIFGFRNGTLESANLNNMSLSFDFKNRSVYWLGNSELNQSGSRVIDLYDEATTDKVRKNLIWMSGSHPSTPGALAFLESILFVSANAELRKSAAYSIGGLDDAGSVRALKKAIESDKELEVRKAAVYGLGGSDLQAARDALFAIIEKSGS